MSYARDTSVPVERSRGEIENILSRYGANSFGYLTEPHQAVIAFKAHGKTVRFFLPIPPLEDYAKNKAGGRMSPSQKLAAHAQAIRSRWRALALCIKAKLEAVECGIALFEEEFLAHIVLPNGKTMGQHAIPMLEEMAKSGKMPQILLQ